MMQKKPVLVVGSAALDSVESPAGKVENVPGGSSFYFAAAAGLLTEVRLVAVVGRDFPMREIDFLRERSVDMSGLEVRDGDTFRWGGRYHDDPNVRDTLYTELGVFEDFDPVIPGNFRETPLVFLGNINPSLQLKVLNDMRRPELVVLDTMNLWINIARDELVEVIGRVNALIVNDEEAMQLTEKKDLRSAADELFRMGPEVLVIKKGQHGAILIRGEDDFFFAPAFPLRTVKDPTGAGDTFAGGFMGYLAGHDPGDRMTWRRAVVTGSVVASFVVEDFSMARLKNLTVEDLDRRMARFRDMVTF